MDKGVQLVKVSGFLAGPYIINMYYNFNCLLKIGVSREEAGVRGLKIVCRNKVKVDISERGA
jgi:hypothetical protein